ncbi:MAG: Asp-tRNA(Asn)/Glu-tRNA(Gln) amidotransferase subunit GatC [Streptococcaceae bacterium]|jgi:aspartyl-tRNA(Asn)/glutamyl-tRNA(Gln) amidotransferase subunit C|nr:Asp-tRNA(Asn)/Glu-tRNA(Gln) amidotransferase subunit GatC [Streptococcaceae bacterium]
MKEVKKLISEKQVKHVANLAKLEFAEEEISSFTNTLDRIIEMFEQLDEVDTTDVPFTSNVVNDINVLREDVPVKGMDRELLMKNVPEKENGFIKLPAVLEDGGDA